MLCLNFRSYLLLPVVAAPDRAAGGVPEETEHSPGETGKETHVCVRVLLQGSVRAPLTAIIVLEEVAPRRRP